MIDFEMKPRRFIRKILNLENFKKNLLGL